MIIASLIYTLAPGPPNLRMKPFVGSSEEIEKDLRYWLADALQGVLGVWIGTDEFGGDFSRKLEGVIHEVNWKWQIDNAERYKMATAHFKGQVDQFFKKDIQTDYADEYIGLTLLHV